MTARRGSDMTADSFKALVENAWFKLGARLLGWVAVPSIFALIGIALTLRADVSDTRLYSMARAADNEIFQKQVLSNDTNTKAQLELLRSGQTAQGKDIALITGVLQQMQRENVAEANARRNGGAGF